jgi:hypothetical protein
MTQIGASFESGVGVVCERLGNKVGFLAVCDKLGFLAWFVRELAVAWRQLTQLA